MATGISRSRWSDELQPSAACNGLRLEYDGKRTEADILRGIPAVSEQVLSVDATSDDEPWGRLYFADNLGVLLALRDDPAVAGKVECVYIDPPFASQAVFQSRSQVDAYHDLRRGSHYVEFIRERLVVLRELMAPDGSIYVHLDENMAFTVKMVMDEVFGQSNFRNWITRRKCNPKNTTRKRYGNTCDYIMFYSKTDKYTWNRPYHAWTDARAMEEYSYVEPETGRQFKKVPIHAPGVRNGATGMQWRGMKPPAGKHWQYTPERLDEMDARGEIFWSKNGNPRRKIYLDESPGVPVQDYWDDVRDAHNQNIRITGYPTEKNPDMVRRILEASSSPGGIVLDAFAGSGTTLDVAHQLGRAWIGMDESAEAIRTTLGRLAAGRERMGDFVNKPKANQSQAGLLPRVGNFQVFAEVSRVEDLRSQLATQE